MLGVGVGDGGWLLVIAAEGLVQRGTLVDTVRNTLLCDPLKVRHSDMLPALVAIIWVPRSLWHSCILHCLAFLFRISHIAPLVTCAIS